MWGIIIVIVVIIIGKFLYDTNQQSSKIKKEGGMRNKYRELIEYLLSGDSRSKIFHETTDSITLGLSNMGGSTLYVLTQAYGRLKVQWKVDSPLFGKHKLDWDFPEYGDQEKMVERILNDVEKYLQNVMTAKSNEYK